MVATTPGGHHPRPEETTVTPDLSLVTEPTPATASAAEFVDAMSALTSGVVLVTCRLDGRPWGMTVTAFASVSADPPTVLVSLGSQTTGARAIAATRSFGVAILAAEQLEVACFGSQPGAAKFVERFAVLDPGSASPVLAGALSHLDCEVVEIVEVADHTVVFGRVRAARTSGEGTPLLYHRRAYRTLAASDRAHPPTGRSLRCLSS